MVSFNLLRKPVRFNVAVNCELEDTRMHLTHARHRRGTQKSLLWSILFVASAFWNSRTSTAQSSELTEIRQIRTLSAEQASTDRPVRLRGVVTAVSGWKTSFFLQDITSGISVDRFDGGPEVQAGQLVEILGVTSPGMFAPIVKANSVTVLGNSKLPLARPVGAVDLAGGAFDSQWTRVQGMVRTAVVKQIWGHDVLLLELDIGGGSLVTARIRSFGGNAWHRLPAATISLRGVCGTVFNDRRQYVGSRIFVSNLDDVKVMHAGPADLFDRPLQPLRSIARFTSGISTFNPIKVRGRVTYWQGEGRVYVQDGSDGILVKTNQQNSFQTGSLVDIVGYAREGDYSPSLEGATLRLASANRTPLQPVSTTASKVIKEKDGFASSPYDSLILRLSGVLKQIVPGVDEQILFLEDGKNNFTARLANSAASKVLPAVGSQLEVTGVCVTRADSSHEPNGFKILLRSDSDLVVLKAAPWWSAQHAKAVVGAMGFAIVVLGVLLTFFRREAALRQLSLSDPLTGVHNRRGFVLLAEQQWRVALRNETPMLLFYIDVNRFKQINDTFGHKEGDAALQRVASTLNECFRSSDIVGRLGGDEFAVLACDALPQSEAILQERLASLVERSNAKSGAKYDLSLSVGSLFCDMRMGGMSVEDLLSRADELMYDEKLGGRETSPRMSDSPPQGSSVHAHLT